MLYINLLGTGFEILILPQFANPFQPDGFQNGGHRKYFLLKLYADILEVTVAVCQRIYPHALSSGFAESLRTAHFSGTKNILDKSYHSFPKIVSNQVSTKSASLSDSLFRSTFLL